VVNSVVRRLIAICLLSAAAFAGNATASATEPRILYEEIAAGSGEMPRDDSYVFVNYTATLTDGTLVSRSEPGYPSRFLVSSLVPGIRQGIKRMAKGAKSRITIPPALAYGDKGSGNIPPGAAVVFEVELVDIHNNPPQE